MPNALAFLIISWLFWTDKSTSSSKSLSPLIELSQHIKTYQNMSNLFKPLRHCHWSNWSFNCLRCHPTMPTRRFWRISRRCRNRAPRWIELNHDIPWHRFYCYIAAILQLQLPKIFPVAWVVCIKDVRTLGCPAGRSGVGRWSLHPALSAESAKCQGSLEGSQGTTRDHSRDHQGESGRSGEFAIQRFQRLSTTSCRTFATCKKCKNTIEVDEAGVTPMNQQNITASILTLTHFISDILFPDMSTKKRKKDEKGRFPSARLRSMLSTSKSEPEAQLMTLDDSVDVRCFWSWHGNGSVENSYFSWKILKELMMSWASWVRTVGFNDFNAWALGGEYK